MSNFAAGGNPNTSAFRTLPPGPHAGVETDAEAHVGASSMEVRARNALTLGVLSLVLGVVTGVPAIWVGRKALVHIERSDGALRGRWVAWTGIALGCLGIALTLAVWTYFHQRG
jgi:uncharacterized protein DUF4190